MVRRKTTQEILGESIHELAKVKSVDKITIKEIVDNCGLSSATFYRHFQDKYELIAWIYNYQLEYIFTDLSEEMETWRQAIYDSVSILDNDRSFYLNAFMHTDGPNSFFMATYSKCEDLLINLIERKCGDKLTEEILFDVDFYMRGSSYTIYEWFVYGKRNYSVEQLTDHLYRIMPDNLKPYLM
ncbi:MAG: TetR/AcrR family transcriptional regulator C-terminal domain-containing protein [Pseudobutyrivibrio sp.]|nr:TetR/AcrR family transcriptional regulator C-terminal domain-containing protein [Pseudobutyrivibrio sp.]